LQFGGYLVLQGTCSERPCPVPQPETVPRVSAPLPTSESEEEKLREGFLEVKKWISFKRESLTSLKTTLSKSIKMIKKIQD
jgi:hypothetical protein